VASLLLLTWCLFRRHNQNQLLTDSCISLTYALCNLTITVSHTHHLFYHCHSSAQCRCLLSTLSLVLNFWGIIVIINICPSGYAKWYSKFLRSGSSTTWFRVCQMSFGTHYLCVRPQPYLPMEISSTQKKKKSRKHKWSLSLSGHTSSIFRMV